MGVLGFRVIVQTSFFYMIIVIHKSVDVNALRLKTMRLRACPAIGSCPIALDIGAGSFRQTAHTLADHAL
jgi:hypothetical protein